MNIAAIQGISQVTPTTRLEAPASTTQNSADGLTSLFKDSLHQAMQLDTDAQQAVTGMLRGQGVDIHDAMIATQKADLSFELALQVRNKAVSAYQQMMQMQF